MKRQRFEIIRGSSRPPLTISLTDSDDDPIDLTGATAARLIATGLPETEVADLEVNKDLDIVSPATGGQLLCEWTSAEVAAIESGSYVGQIEVELADGETGIWGEIDLIVVPPRKKQT